MYKLFYQGLLLFLILTVAESTINAQAYFQQKTDFNITASLDTLNQTLTSDILLSYTNNSPDDLSQIYFHVWWNAYSDKRSAYAEQALEIGRRDFFFADDESMGGYKELEFNYKGEKIEYTPYEIDGKTYSDIIVIDLPQPIKANSTVEFRIHFQSDIPFAFSRAGYKDELYRMTQWYPKPAVYDVQGWHPMPYLEMGEYYSEFGDYNIELKIPASHSIACTGTVDESRTEYSSTGKLLYINAENVIDFAWFSSENYIPYRENVIIEGGSVAVNVFAEEDNDKWSDMMTFAKRSIEFYSEEVGPYPYPQVTVVAEQSGNGSGMEYPMITLIDSDNTLQVLDHLVAHEIGHNWFQAILASDERTYTWMDEGINTYYEQKYTSLYHDKGTYDDVPSLWNNKKRDYSLLQAGIVTLERTNRSLPINLHSEDFDFINYVSMNYEKMAWSNKYLAHYLGEDIFKKAIQTYYREWQFRHPTPSDFQVVLEKVSGKNLSWFFDDYINSSTPVDLSIGRIQSNYNNLEVVIKNKGSYKLPYEISAYAKDGRLLYQEWHDSPEANEISTIFIPVVDAHKIAINGESLFVDVSNADNVKYVRRPLLAKPLRFNLLGGFENNSVHDINLFPSLLANEYDGLMLGAVLTNAVFPIKNTRWYIAPNYGLKSGRVSGNFKVEKDFLLHNKTLRKYTFGLFGQTFSYRRFEDLNLAYRKITPDVSIHFSKGVFHNSSLQYKLHIINQDFLNFDTEVSIDNEWSVIHQLNYSRRTRNRLSKNNLLIQLEYENYKKPFDEQANYLKLSVTNNKSIYYNKNSQFHVRFFGGYFIQNSERESSSFSNNFSKASFALTSQGFTDHLFEELYIARSGRANNEASSQVTIAEGGFKNAFGSGFKTGFSNDYLLTTNIKVDLPLNFIRVIKIRPYIDIAYTSTKEVTSDPLKGRFLYSGGLSLEISNLLGVYVPLLNSTALKTNYGGDNIWNRISFTYNLQGFNPWKIQDDPSRLF
jgi:hypothetical protein